MHSYRFPRTDVHLGQGLNQFCGVSRAVSLEASAPPIARKAKMEA